MRLTIYQKSNDILQKFSETILILFTFSLLSSTLKSEMLNTVKDRLLQVRLQKDERKISIIISIMFFLIVGLIGYSFFLTYQIAYNRPAAHTENIQPSASNNSELILTPTPCPACIISPTVSVNPTTYIVAKITPIDTDYFIPLGTGVNTSTDWTDVPGVQSTIDFGQYNHLKEIHFEASVYIPSANEFVQVRLYNETDKHPVWNSDVMMNSGTSALLISQPISYDTGLKLYQVQMKSQLGAPANLVESRIHVTAQ